jgi:hypothetical protein
MGLVNQDRSTKTRAPEGNKVKRSMPQIELPTLSKAEKARYKDPTIEGEFTQKTQSQKNKNDERTKTTRETASKTVHFDEPEQDRPFDDVEPLDRPPIPKEHVVERGMAHRQDKVAEPAKPEVKRGAVIKPIGQSKITSKSEENTVPSLEAAVLERYLSTGATIPLGELLTLAPSVRKLLARKCRFRNVNKKPISSFYAGLPQTQVFTMTTEVLQDLESSDFVVDASELCSPDDTFETFFDILEKETDGMPVGTIVHRDIIESYLNETDSEGKKIILVAAPSEDLRCIFPRLNGHPDPVEGILDMGSMILCIDKRQAVGRGIEWDPSTVLHMQSANGSLNRTLGLARNVLMEIGDLQFRAQLHVVEKAPYHLLIGRPFESLTCMETKGARDGSLELTLTCPNTGHKIQMGTYPRGRGVRVEKDEGRGLEPSERPPADQNNSSEDAQADANFQTTSMNC